MKHAALALIASLTAAAPALASSPDAWREHDAKAASACAAKSGFRGARTSAPTPFSDTVGRTAVLVTGAWPQPHMKGRRGVMLCLFDRRTGRAETAEVSGWSAPVR